MEKKQRELHVSFRPCRDYLIAMVPLLVMACVLYGYRPLIMMGVSMVTALLCDVLAALMRRAPFVASDISSYMFAAVFTIMLPASVGYGVVMVGTAVTVLLGKHAFGGYGNYPFNPAAFGFAFASICWADTVFMYPKSFSMIGLGLDSGAAVQSGVANVLKHGGVPEIDRLDLIIGNYPGPMGTTFCLIILASLVLLIAHHAMTWHIPVTYLVTCAVWAFLLPRTSAGNLESVLLEMFSGAIIFSAVFIVAEPTTAPAHPVAKLVYGFLLGVGTMIFRTFGVYEMGVCFAILLINPIASYLDRIFSGKALKAKGAKI